MTSVNNSSLSNLQISNDNKLQKHGNNYKYSYKMLTEFCELNKIQLLED